MARAWRGLARPGAGLARPRAAWRGLAPTALPAAGIGGGATPRGLASRPATTGAIAARHMATPPLSPRIRRPTLLIAVAAAGVALAAAQEAPRSILPEGVFAPAQRPAEPPSDQPGTAPAEDAEVVPTLPPGPAGPGRAAAPAQTAAGESRAATPLPGVPAGAEATAAGPPSPLDIPADAIDLTQAGLLTPAAGGMAPTAFSGGNTAFLIALMRDIRPPLASRWAHITVRRALASRLATPADVPPGDWIAARARLLVRMGEGDVAHALLARLPVESFTPALYGTAADAMLAAGDLPGLCPLSATGEALTGQDFWRIANALCLALEGDELSAANRFDRLRRDRPVLAFDIAMAERAASMVGGGRSANLAWEEAQGPLTLYRIGMAGATAATIPERALRTASPPAMGWLFRQAGASDPLRLAAAFPAAAQGIVGAAELVGFLSQLADSPDAAGVGRELITQLRLAYGGSARQRSEALAALWREPDPVLRYGRLVLTAPLAAGMRPAEELGPMAPDIMASALAGGRADRAMAWWRLAEAQGSEIAARAWALAALADARAEVDVSPASFRAWLAADAAPAARRGHRARLLLAALDGLGRLEGDDWASVRAEHPAGPAAARWAARLEAAARARRPGEVALIAAAGLQGDWSAVPPAHLSAILRAYRAVGLAGEARLIAAEALTRA